MTHHHAHQRTQSWNLWRNLVLIWSVVVALLVHRTTHLGIVSAIVIGFATAAAALWVIFVAIDRHNSAKSEPPASQ
jgi:hypothetical protein